MPRTTSGTLEKLLKKVTNKTSSPHILIDLDSSVPETLISKTIAAWEALYYLTMLISSVSHYRSPAVSNIRGSQRLLPDLSDPIT